MNERNLLTKQEVPWLNSFLFCPKIGEESFWEEERRNDKLITVTVGDGQPGEEDGAVRN